MTVEELHAYNRTHAVSDISYEAVAKDEAVIEFRKWIRKWLEVAYDAGFRNAKNGEV